MNENQNKKGVTLSPAKITIIIIVVLLLIAGGVTLGLNWNNWFNKTPEVTQSNSVSPDLDPDAEDWTGEQPDNVNDQTGGKGGISCPGYGTITMAAGKKEQSVNFYNPKENTCYFVITLSLPDGTQIYKSKMIEPGKGIYQITLDKELTAGTYENAVLKYTPYKMNDELTPLNNAEMKFTLEVK